MSRNRQQISTIHKHVVKKTAEWKDGVPCSCFSAQIPLTWADNSAQNQHILSCRATSGQAIKKLLYFVPLTNKSLGLLLFSCLASISEFS